MKQKKDRRIHRSTLHVVAIGLLVGIVALTFSFTIAWGKHMKTVEATASAEVFMDFETETLFGDPYTEQDTAKARITAFNVWETTCPACLGEMGELEKLSGQYPPEEFQLVGVCLDLFDVDGNLKPGQLKKAQDLMKNAGTTFPHIIPTKEMRGYFRTVIPGFPTTFFVDQNGKILSFTTGADNLAGWTQKVDKVLKEEK